MSSTEEYIEILDNLDSDEEIICFLDGIFNEEDCVPVDEEQMKRIGELVKDVEI
jgi:hypothetical protein